MKFADTYADVKQFQGLSLRNSFRHVALHAVASRFSMSHDIRMLLRKKRIQFLYIHHIFRDEEQQLKQLLDKLSATHVFISYSDAVSKIQQGNIDKPYICISSDDGLINNLRAGEILKDFGISACFFICPSVIGEQRTDVLSEFSKRRLDFPAVEFLNWQGVDRLMKLGHEIGGHTMNHVMISETAAEELDFELQECFNVIQRRCGVNPHFAYPYGRYFHFTIDAMKKVMSIGYKSCASAERGCHVRDSDTFMPTDKLLLRRDHVMLSWPWKHIEYFMAKNSLNASEQSNFYPEHAHRYSYKQS